MANRLERLEAVKLCRSWAEQAAIFNESWTTNPYPKPSYLWALWAATYQATIERLAAQEESGQ